MKKPQVTWKDSDINYLKNVYGKIPTREIALNMGRTYESVKSKSIKVLKLFHPGIQKNNLSSLFEDTNENWYWLGFIAADGHLSKQYLSITLDQKDTDHLQLLANKLNVSLNYSRKNCIILAVSDTNNIENLKIKLGQFNTKAKTYNPLNINYFISKEQYLSFIIGFIDGDGCIEVRNNKMAQLKIECHSSWYDNLLFISEFLKNNYNIPSTTIINKRGYTLWKITSHKNGLKLRDLIYSLKIPYLKRKWESFNSDTLGTNFYRNIEQKVIELYKEGNNLYKISKILNVNYHSLNNHKKELIKKVEYDRNKIT